MKFIRSPRIIYINTFKTRRLKVNCPVIAGFECNIPGVLLSENVYQQVKPRDGQTDASVFFGVFFELVTSENHRLAQLAVAKIARRLQLGFKPTFTLW